LGELNQCFGEIIVRKGTGIFFYVKSQITKTMDTIYTDGHGIKITPASFIVGKTSYRMDGIINARINMIKATLAPAILLIILGIAGLVTGMMKLYGAVAMEPFYIGETAIDANRLAIITGFILAIAGIICAAMLRDKYTVHITTAEGEKDPVVSKSKDYVTQIVNALQDALRFR